MTLRHARSFRPAFVLLMLLAVSAASCSGTKKVVDIKPTPIPHADADDIVQLIATTLSNDNGGWYCTVKAMCETLSVPAPAGLTSGAGGSWAMPMSARPGLRNNYTFTKAGVTYLFQTGWARTDGSVTSERDTSSRNLLALIAVDGGAFNGANGINGTYGVHTYALNSPIDSTFFVGNLATVDPDTLEFSGFLDDSSFASVQSTITPTSARLWYHQNFVDYTLLIPKSSLISSPYPVGIDSEIRWTIEAMAMTGNSLLRTDFALDDLVEARMVFDGSADAVLTLADIVDEPAWTYVYKVNLNTGLITRLN